MAISDFVKLFGKAAPVTAKEVAQGHVAALPGALAADVVGGVGKALGPLNEAYSQFTQAPIVQGIARGAAGSSGGMPAVYDMAALQAQAKEQRRQQAFTDELSKAFPTAFDPMDENQMNAWLQIAGRHYPERLPELAAHIYDMRAQFIRDPINVPEGGAVLDPYTLEEAYRNPKKNEGKTVRIGKDGVGIVEDGELRVLREPTAGSGSGSIESKDAKVVRDLRENDPQAKEWDDIAAAYKQLQALGSGIESGNFSGTDYVAMLYKFIRGLDNSRVTEGEKDLVEKMQSLMTQASTLKSQVTEGKPDPELARNILSTAKVLARAAAESQKGPWREYLDTARSFQDDRYTERFYKSGFEDPEAFLANIDKGGNGKPKRPQGIPESAVFQGYDADGSQIWEWD